MYKTYLETPVGELELVEEEAGLCSISFDRPGKYRDVQEWETALLSEAKQQLQEYFEGKRKEFTLPLSLHGTEFQLRDWNALLKIPYGETRSYGEIARAIDCPKGFRAVGAANHRNPLVIVVPCHRVIGGDGKLVGYGGRGKGLDTKEFLLKLEGAL